MPEENGISRREFLKLIGYMGIVSLGGLGGLFELYKKNRSFPPSLIPPLISPPLQTAFAQTTGGTWSLGQNTTGVAIHTALTYTGKILYVSGSGYCINNQAGPYTGRLLDPTTGVETSVTMSDDLFCGGAAQLPNGNILFVAGTLLYDTDVNNCNGQWHGSSAAYEFDVPSGNLIKQTSMAHGRWYPTLVTLPNGNVIVVSGSDEYGTYNYLAEVYNSSSKSWTIQYDPTSNNTYIVGAGQTACPGAGSPSYGGPNQGTTPWLSLYPRMNLMPSGLVFQSGQIQQTHLWDPSSGAWTNVNTTLQYRDYGTSILLPLQNTTTERGKVMIVGGSTTGTVAATNVVEIEDFNQGTSTAPVLRTTGSLNNGRKYILPIILPNGKVVVFGGTSLGFTSYVYVPEIFDPENESQGWVVLPAATVGRTYHGVALLLPDGSVWTASSTPNPCQPELRTEIFKPDYFAATTRPTISGTPIVGAYGQSITIPTPNPSSVSRVSLVRLGATTHHFDTNVRLIWLQITGTGTNSITVSAPLNANLAPPGYYMIHVLDTSFVPSTAQIIKIPGAQAPAQVTGVTVTAAGSTQLNLSWTANTEPDLNHYNVYRSTTYGFAVNTATDTPLATPTTNSFSDTGLTASTTYYYKVAAVNNSAVIGAVSIQTYGDTAPTTTTGQHAISLDGIVQYIDAGTGSTLQVGETAGSEASYSMWVKYHLAPSTNPGVFMRRGPTGSFVPYLGTNGVLGCDVHYNTQLGDFFNGGALSTDTWHHVVITHSNVTNTTVLYLDGASVASSTKNDFLLNTGTDRHLMGATVLAATKQTNFFPGKLDDARVYSTALSSSEVSSLFAGNNITRGLVSRWTFDEGTGTVAHDTVGTNNATLSPADGAPPWTSDVPAALSSGGGTAPAQVTGVSVTTPTGTTNTLNLSWTANTEPDLSHYNIYRSTTNGFTVNTATDIPIAKPTTNSYSDTGLTASTTYYYKVAAVNNAGLVGAVSAQASGSIMGSGYASLGGYILGDPAVARNSDGRLEVFVIGSDHALYHNSQGTPGSSNSWTGFGKLGASSPSIIGNPAVAQNADGRLEVFVVGSDHALYHTFQLTAGSSSSWSGFTSLGGYIISNPVVAQNSDGRLEVFVIGSDHALYHNYQTTPSSNTWSGFIKLGGYIISNPVVAQNSDGRLEVFVIGSDHALYHNYQAAPSSINSWSGYASLGGYILGDPAVARNSDGRLEVFVIGSDHALYHNYQAAPSSINSWSGFAGLGGVILSNTNPAVALNSQSQMQVFVIGADSAIYNKFQTTAGGSSWTGFSKLVGVSVISNPVIGANSDGRLELFVVGTDHALYHNF